MNKQDRYNFIAQLVNPSHVLNASKVEVEEEAKLVSVSNDDNSIADEAASEIASKKMLRSMEERAEMKREREEDSLLSSSERAHLARELGRAPRSIILKKQEAQNGN